MNKSRKMAWFLIISISMALLMLLALIAILYFKAGLPRTIACIVILAVAGIGGLGPLFFRRGKVDIQPDQYKRFISRQRVVTGFAASYLVLCLTCIVAFFLFGPRTTISATWLPNVLGASGLTYFLTYSLTILVQYRGRAKENE